MAYYFPSAKRYCLGETARSQENLHDSSEGCFQRRQGPRQHPVTRGQVDQIVERNLQFPERVLREDFLFLYPNFNATETREISRTLTNHAFFIKWNVNICFNPKMKTRKLKTGLHF